MKIENTYGQEFDVPPELEYITDKHIEAGNSDKVDHIVAQIPNLKNKPVSTIWKEKTGTSWEEAKKQGLTDGSYEANLKLKSSLIEGKFDKMEAAKSPSSNPVSQETIDKTVKNLADAATFKDAFKIAREQLGPNKLFEWNGKKYGTNVAGEQFNPAKEDLQKFNLDTPDVIQSLLEQNKLVASPYSKKEVVKVGPEYKNWEKIKERNTELNKLDDASKIISYQKDKDEQYLVVDKKAARMHLYKGDKLIDSFEVGTGKNKGDAQTVTKIKDGKVDWDASNKTTGAGVFTINNALKNNEHYSNAASFNLKNEAGIEVPMAIHATLSSRKAKFNNNNLEDNRMSNGCINGICSDVNELYGKHGVRDGTKVYILPEDEGNRFVQQDGKIILKTTAKTRQQSLEYTDATGTTQKGQGVNTTKNTLVYKPIKTYVDKPAFEKDVYQWNDLNDDAEYSSTTEPFVKSLSDNKQSVMKAAKISSDTYNEIAKIAFGIYGTESNFGDTHSATGNLARAANKYMDPKSSSSPDYESKASTYGASKENNSVGLTQIRFSYLNIDEKKALAEVGINSNKDFLDPTKAAMGTAVVLGVRYNQQLNDKEKQDIWATLPTKWNNRSNYPDRVKKNSRYLSIKQLD